MEELEAFRDELLARVRVRASADSNFAHSAFAELSGELLEEAEELFDFAPCFYRGKGARSRNVAVDGYAFDDADNSARLMLAVFSGDQATSTLTRTDAKSHFTALVSFVEDSMKGLIEKSTDESTPEHGLSRDLRLRAQGTSRFRCFLVTDSLLSEKVKDWPEGEIGGVPVEFHIWDVGRFHRAHQSRSGRDELIVDFADIVPDGLPCLPAGVEAGTYDGYLCVLPGAALANIYERYGSRLLEGNVRAFLSTTVKVNRGIQQTLQREPRMFFAFNNGISATASRIDLVETAQGTRIRSAADFQIVNGGQTTASIAHARRKGTSDLAGVFVQMKLSVVSEEDSGQLIPFISRYSNSQNKVSDADFFSNHEFHRQIEKISRRLRAPAQAGSQVETFWFYERARGQYAVEGALLTASQKRRFDLENPRSQIITKTDLAKVENSWRKLPHEVSRGAQKNFIRFAEHISAEWDKDSTRFHDEFFRSAVAKVIIFRALERLVPKETWYSGGYRANIVTFAVAKLVDLVEGPEGRRRVNLELVWKKQAVSPALQEQLRLISEAAYKVLIEPEAGIQNVTEWAKKDIAWQRLRAVRIPLLEAFEAELVDPDIVASRNRTARDDARVDAGLDALQQVLAFGATNWAGLRSAAVAASAITPQEEVLLRAASTPGRLPTDFQAKKLVQLRQRLSGDGIGEH